MKNGCLLLVMITAGLCSCKKTDSSNGNTVSGTLQPVTVGSSWSYQVSENFSPSSSQLLSEAALLGYSFPAFDTSYTVNVKAIGADTIINGMQYAILQQDSTVGNNIYSSREDTNYYGIGIVPDFSITDNLQASTGTLPLLYLKDQPAGTTWVQSVIGAGSTPGTYDTTVYTLKIIATGLSKAENGNTYSNVIHEQITVLPGGLSAITSIPGFPTSLDLSITGDYYFARNVGLIEVDVNSLLYGLSYTEQITASSIK